MKKRVYLTALTNERYIPGVMALARSLREVKSKYDLAVMIPAEKEDALGRAIREYGILDVPGTFLLPRENIRLAEMDAVVENAYSYWRDTFFKLQAAGCTEFDKVILLDSDMLVLNNLDHLFQSSSFSAAVAGKCVHPEWRSLNSGLMVIEPSDQLHDRLLSLIVSAIEVRKSKGLQAGDQDVFHLAYPEWHNHSELYLSEKYNTCWGWIPEVCRSEMCKNDDLFVIHFVGKQKPWDLGKLYFLRLFASMLLRGKWDKLLYKAFIWKKYRYLCEKA